MITPVDREFAVQPVGYIRDQVVLANFRHGLRQLINPQTGAKFTEDEIAAATRPGSRWYREAQAIDDYGQGRQKNALWLADQIRLDRASSTWLRQYHGEPRGIEQLPATGGSGSVLVDGAPGTIVMGSTTIGAPGTYTARAPDGSVFQVYIPTTIGPSGSVVATLQAVSTGSNTNIDVDTVLEWITRDPSMAPRCRVVGARFQGGTDVETIAEYRRRVASAMRFKPAAGNDPQMRAWGREASNAIEDAFVYACALHAGTTVVAITGKRGTTEGPLGRIPAVGVLGTATAYLVPPMSPVLPPRSFVLVVSARSEPDALVLRMGMAKGTDAGWTDARPFPSYHATTPSITAVTSQTVFDVTCPGDATLPGQDALATVTGDDAPALMLWDTARSKFREVSVLQVQDLGSNVYRVTIASAPSGLTIATGIRVSPDMSRRAIVGQAVSDYFDELGPGDFFNTETDPRGGRCIRFPEVTDEFPRIAGSTVATRVTDALGGGVNVVLASMALTEPTYPTSILDGPNLLTAGDFGIYPL